MSNPVVHNKTPSAKIKGAMSNLPLIPTQAPIGDKANDKPSTTCDKFVNLFVYEYPNIIMRAIGEISNERLFKPAAQTTNRAAQVMVKIQRVGFPIYFCK